MSEAAVVTAPAENTAPIAPTSAPQAVPDAGEGVPTPTPPGEGGAAPATHPNDTPTGPLDKRAARQAMHRDREARRQQVEPAAPVVAEAPVAPPAEATPEQGTEAQAEPVVDEHGRKHDPATGQFLPGEDAPNAQAAEGSPADVTAEPKAAPEGSPEKIRVEIPESHPLRGMGLEALDAPDAQQERAIRALLNSHKRTAEVEQERNTRRQVEEQLVEVQARAEVAQERVRTLISDPSLASIYADLKQAYGEDHANRWLDGELRQDEGQIAERRQALQQQRLQQELPVMGQQFREQVLSDPHQFVPVESFAPPHLSGDPVFARVAQQVSVEAVQQALHAYADALDRQGIQDIRQPYRMEEMQRYLPNPSELHARLQFRILQDPEARAALQQRRDAEARKQAADAARQKAEAEARAERERKAAAEQAVEEFKQQAAQTRTQQPPHPMGSLTGAVRGDKVSTVGTAEGGDPSQVPIHDLKRQLKQSARQDARARFGLR
jgi:hypothetical protein